MMLYMNLKEFRAELENEKTYWGSLKKIRVHIKIQKSKGIGANSLRHWKLKLFGLSKNVLLHMVTHYVFWNTCQTKIGK